MAFEIANKFKFKIIKHQQKPIIREDKLKQEIKNRKKCLKN